jgi:formylmethanofuran dehydrogenase subunit C
VSTLSLREAPPERLDFLTINPLALGGLSAAEAERLPVGTSRRGVRLGDCFSISLDRSDTLHIEGGHERLDRVGAALSAGTIRVTGDVGQRLGERLAGGALHVSGTCGPYAGAGATGGTITVEGDAGDHAGGAVYAGRR